MFLKQELGIDFQHSDLHWQILALFSILFNLVLFCTRLDIKTTRRFFRRRSLIKFWELQQKLLIKLGIRCHKICLKNNLLWKVYLKFFLLYLAEFDNIREIYKGNRLNFNFRNKIVFAAPYTRKKHPRESRLHTWEALI